MKGEMAASVQPLGVRICRKGPKSHFQLSMFRWQALYLTCRLYVVFKFWFHYMQVSRLTGQLR